MELCLPPACDSPQHFAAVEGWRRHLEVDQWVGTSWGIIHLTCRIQMGFCSLFAQKSKISASIAMEGREAETRAECRVGWKQWPLFRDHGGSSSPAPLFSRPDLRGPGCVLQQVLQPQTFCSHMQQPHCSERHL